MYCVQCDLPRQRIDELESALRSLSTCCHAAADSIDSVCRECEIQRRAVERDLERIRAILEVPDTDSETELLHYLARAQTDALVEIDKLLSKEGSGARGAAAQPDGEAMNRAETCARCGMTREQHPFKKCKRFIEPLVTPRGFVDDEEDA